MTFLAVGALANDIGRNDCIFCNQTFVTSSVLHSEVTAFVLSTIATKNLE